MPLSVAGKAAALVRSSTAGLQPTFHEATTAYRQLSKQRLALSIPSQSLHHATRDRILGSRSSAARCVATGFEDCNHLWFSATHGRSPLVRNQDRSILDGPLDGGRAANDICAPIL
jgi:hypothetical protein